TLHQGDSSVTVALTGNIITKVDFFLDDSVNSFASDSSSPFAATLSTAGLTAGEHYVRALIEISVLGEASTVTRLADFFVDPDTGPPVSDTLDVLYADVGEINPFGVERALPFGQAVPIRLTKDVPAGVYGVQIDGQ